MSSQTKVRKRPPSISSLIWTRRFQQSWTSWRQKRLSRRLKAEQLRYRLMLAQQDSQLLRLKFLEEQLLLLQQQQVEQRDSLRYRQLGLLPKELPPVEKSELDQLLGL